MFFVLVLPQYDVIKSAKEALAQRNEFLTQRTAQFNKVKELDAQARARQADIIKIRSFMPANKQIDEIVSSFQSISEGSGMQLVSMNTSEALNLDNANYKKLLIGIDLIGPYPAFIGFLKLLEQSLRLYDISEMIMTISTSSVGRLNFSLKINSYYLK